MTALTIFGNNKTLRYFLSRLAFFINYSGLNALYLSWVKVTSELCNTDKEVVCYSNS